MQIMKAHVSLHSCAVWPKALLLLRQLEKASDKEPDIWPHWMAVHVRFSLVTRKPVFGVCDRVILQLSAQLQRQLES